VVIALTVVVAVLALLVFVLAGAVVELNADVRQLRDVAGILDRALDVDIAEVQGTKPSSYGLPQTLDSAASALVLFVSDRCATCHVLADGLSGGLPTGLWLVLEARSPESAEEFLKKHGMTQGASDGRLFVDVAGKIASSIGLNTTPVGFRVESGLLRSATTVPSQRYLSSIVPNAVGLERGTLERERQRSTS